MLSTAIIIGYYLFRLKFILNNPRFPGELKGRTVTAPYQINSSRVTLEGAAEGGRVFSLVHLEVTVSTLTYRTKVLQVLDR